MGEKMSTYDNFDSGYSADYDGFNQQMSDFDGGIDYGTGLADENGKIIDYNEGRWGSGIRRKDRAEVLAAFATAQATIDAAFVEAQTAAYVATTESEAMVASAEAQATASMHSDDKAFEGIEVQANTDIQVAQLEYDLGVLENETAQMGVEVDKMNAEANGLASQALVLEAEAKNTEAEAERDEVEYEYLYDNDSSAWG